MQKILMILGFAFIVHSTCAADLKTVIFTKSIQEPRTRQKFLRLVRKCKPKTIQLNGGLLEPKTTYTRIKHTKKCLLVGCRSYRSESVLKMLYEVSDDGNAVYTTVPCIKELHISGYKHTLALTQTCMYLIPNGSATLMSVIKKHYRPKEPTITENYAYWADQPAAHVPQHLIQELLHGPKAFPVDSAD